MANFYSNIVSGEIQGGTTAFQLPDIPCSRVKIRARQDNAGNVYIGGAGLTKPDGASDVTTGFELDSGQDTGWLDIANLNMLYAICNANGDDLTYIAFI